MGQHWVRQTDIAAYEKMLADEERSENTIRYSGFRRNSNHYCHPQTVKPQFVLSQ